MKETELIDFLKSYSIDKKFIDAQKYAMEYLNEDGTMTPSVNDERLRRMKAVESSIELLNPSEEHTLLYLHYINNIPVERCAECMYIARATAFRLLRKAHTALCEKLTKKENN